jgi:hypothetical protein
MRKERIEQYKQSIERGLNNELIEQYKKNSRIKFKSKNLTPKQQRVLRAYYMALTTGNTITKSIKKAKSYATFNEYLRHLRRFGLFIGKDYIEGTRDDGMEIADGGSASLEYYNTHYGDVSAEEKARVRSALEKYCHLDTISMVWMVDALEKLIKK